MGTTRRICYSTGACALLGVLAVVGSILAVFLLRGGSGGGKATPAPGPLSPAGIAVNNKLYQYIVVPTTSGRDRATSICLSNSGTQYVVGLFRGNLKHTPYTIRATGASYDLYVTRFTAGGDVQWTTSVPIGSELGFPPEVVCDETGAYVAGHLRGNATFGGTVLSSVQSTAWVGKISSAGVWQWARAVETGGITFSGDLDLTPSALFLAFNTRARRVALGGLTVGWPVSPLAAPALRPVLAKLSLAGVPQWLLGASHASRDARALAVAAFAGGACIAGGFRGQLSLNGTLLTTLTSESIASESGENGESTDSDLYLACTTDGSEWTWSLTAHNSGSNFSAQALAAAGSTDLYLTGSFDETAAFGSHVLASTGRSDLFVARVTVAASTGSWAWASRGGGILNDFSSSVVLSGSYAYIAGSLRRSATFTSVLAGENGENSVDITYEAETGAEEIFVASLHTNGTWAWLSTSEAEPANSAEVLGLALTEGVLNDGWPMLCFCGFFGGTLMFKDSSYTAASQQDTFMGRLRVDRIVEA
jgi:hypothetical protein